MEDNLHTKRMIKGFEEWKRKQEEECPSWFKEVVCKVLEREYINHKAAVEFYKEHIERVSETMPDIDTFKEERKKEFQDIHNHDLDISEESWERIYEKYKECSINTTIGSRLAIKLSGEIYMVDLTNMGFTPPLNKVGLLNTEEQEHEQTSNIIDFNEHKCRSQRDGDAGTDRESEGEHPKTE